MQDSANEQTDATDEPATGNETCIEDDAIGTWLRAAVLRGDLSVDAMAQAMQSDGYGEHDAHLLAALGMLRHESAPLHTALEHSRLQDAMWSVIKHFRTAKRGASSAAIASVNAPPSPLAPREVKNVPVRMVCASPELALLDDVLSAEECSALIELARSRLSANRVMGELGDIVDEGARSSSGCFLTPGTDTLLDQIESKISALVQWPVACMEDLAIVRYAPGEQFSPHLDYFDSAQILRHREELDLAGQRIGTFLLYLSEVSSGGTTSFDLAGIEVIPRRGSAVYFTYRLPDGSMDEGSLHGGTPVLEGEKWIATLWLREKPLRKPATP